VRKRSYVPRRGDVAWLSFHPQAGHEQAGRRPAVVLSPQQYNARVGLALFCPITSRAKGYGDGGGRCGREDEAQRCRPATVL